MSSTEIITLPKSINGWYSLLGGDYEHYTGFVIKRIQMPNGTIAYALFDPDATNYIYGSNNFYKTINEADRYVQAYIEINDFDKASWEFVKLILRNSQP